jgi:hypothetical protein
MPIDPMTGQELPYYGSYGSSGGGQLASTGARMAGVESPLAFDVLGSAPGLTSLAMFNARRGANTIMKCVFLDTQRTAGGRFGRGSYVGPLGYRRKKTEQLAARLRW